MSMKGSRGVEKRREVRLCFLFLRLFFSQFMSKYAKKTITLPVLPLFKSSNPIIITFEGSLDE